MKRKVYSLLVLFVLLSVVSTKADIEDKGKKLLQHVLLFKWTDDVDQEAKSNLLGLFTGLPDKVEGFENVEIYDLTNSSGEYNFILILQFTSEEALAEYENHSDHKKITEMGPPLLSKFEVIDYWK